MEFTFRGKVGVYHGPIAWHIVALPDARSRTLKKSTGGRYIPVTVTIGETTWQTTLFTKRERSLYYLMIKRAVLRSEEIREGDTVSAQIMLRLVRTTKRKGYTQGHGRV